MTNQANTYHDVLNTIEKGNNQQALEAAIGFTGDSADTDPSAVMRNLYELLANTVVGIDDLISYETMGEFLESFGESCEEIAEIAGISLVSRDTLSMAQADQKAVSNAFDKIMDAIDVATHYDQVDSETFLAGHRPFIAIAFRAALIESNLELPA